MLPEVLGNLPKLDIVFFDANHTYEATINYFEQCLPKAHSKTVFIFDDIHWSEEMERSLEQNQTTSKNTSRHGLVPNGN